MAAPGPLYEVSYLSATIGTSETTVAHGGSKAPDWVSCTPQNAAAHYANMTKAPDATNVYLIADTASLTVKIKCEWFQGK